MSEGQADGSTEGEDRASEKAMRIFKGVTIDSISAHDIDAYSMRTPSLRQARDASRRRARERDLSSREGSSPGHDDSDFGLVWNGRSTPLGGEHAALWLASSSELTVLTKRRTI